MLSWLSDSLCRLSTGGGFATRTLYSNDEETFLDATRPVILTGITDFVSRGDLIDRSLFLHLPVIPEEKRRSERQFWGDFELLPRHCWAPCSMPWPADSASCRTSSRGPCHAWRTSRYSGRP